MTDNVRLYICNICNKKYAGYKSLWCHNKKFHSIQSIVISEQPHQNNNNQSILNCKYCNKQYHNRSNKWRHEKICKTKKQIIIDSTKIGLLENKIIELENKIETKNNLLNQTVNNTNNGTIINNNIKISLGNEELEKLSKKEKKQILNSGYSSLIKLIEFMHLNKDYPEFQNIKIHNLKDKYAKTYDDTIQNFTTVNKKDTIDSLICYRTLNLKSIYEDHNKSDNKLHQCVLKLIDKIESYSPDTDDKNILEFYKHLTHEIILLIYNKTKLFEN